MMSKSLENVRLTGHEKRNTEDHLLYDFMRMYGWAENSKDDKTNIAKICKL